VLAAAVLVAAALAGCSSDDGGGEGSSASDGSVAAETSSTPVTAPVDQTAPAGANGIVVDGEGQLWVAVLNGDELVRVDAETGAVLQRISTPTGSGPDDLVLADDGETIWWTAYSSGQVASVSTAPAPGDEPVRLDAELAIGNGANPIAFRSDGDLVVGRAVVGSGLYVISPDDGTVEPLGDPGGLNGFAISANDVLYGPLPGPGAGLAVVDATTGEVEGHIDVPGAAFAVKLHDDLLYVLSLADSVASVYTVDPAGGEAVLFGTTDLGIADNLAVADDGTVYVTGFSNPSVAVLSPDGEQTATLSLGG
jgi:sugar lactone lactonase YvrE